MYRILIVDDEPYTAHALSAMLEEALNEEAELYCAYSGAQALELLHSGRIDMLLCDVQMPGMTGLALSEEVRRCQPQCKIIVFTAYGEFDYAYRAMQLNCAAYILKYPRGTILHRCRAQQPPPRGTGPPSRAAHDALSALSTASRKARWRGTRPFAGPAAGSLLHFAASKRR